MSGDSLMFDEFIALCDEQYEYGLIEFRNGDVVNGPGENDGSAKVLSYAALANFDKDMTLKVSRGDFSPTSLSLFPPVVFLFVFLSKIYSINRASHPPSFSYSLSPYLCHSPIPSKSRAASNL